MSGTKRYPSTPAQMAAPARTKESSPAQSPAFVKAEDPGLFDRLHARLQREWKPIGVIEQILVEQIARCCVRFHRATVFEENQFCSLPVTKPRNSIPEEFRQQLLCLAISLGIPPEKPVNDATVAAAIRSLPSSLLEDLEKLKTKGPEESLANIDSLRQLQMYIAKNEASFFKAARELERVQEGRRRQSGNKLPARPRR